MAGPARSISPGHAMRTLSAVLFSCALIPLFSCGDSCEFGANCWVSSSENRSIQIHGTAEFSDDDRDVKSLTPGGFVLIREGSWMNPYREYKVQADDNGNLTRTYFVDGQKRPLNGAAQAWVAAEMLRLIRETGIGAAARVQRILRAGGPTAVLTEIAQIDSDGSKRTYLRELIDNGHLNEGQFRDAMRAARRIGSDGDKAQLLIDVADQYLRDDLREAWFNAASSIGSDGDRRRVLGEAVRQDRSGETLALAARSAGGIGSDGDKSALLVEIAHDFKPQARQAWFHAASTIGSDGDRLNALRALLRSSNTQPDTMVDLLHCAAGIGSDGDKAALLRDAAAYPLTDPAVQHAFFTAANTMGSDGDRASVLSALLTGPSRDAGVLAGIADSARHIGSDGDKASVLTRVADARMDEPSARQSFFAAVNTIGSDDDRTRVLTQVIRQQGVPAETVVAAIEAAASIGSDDNKARLLVLAADTHAADPAVRAALEKALESIHSDNDYRRVTSALLHKTT